MSKKVYLITRSVVALAAVAVFFWLFLVPPKLNTGMGNEYSSCHAVGWNFSGVQDPLVNDSFDVESPSKVQRYLDGAIAYKMEATEKVRSDIQRLCHEARLERSVLIVSSLIVFAVVFLSVPKPKPSRGKRLSGEGGSLGDNGSSNGKGSSGNRSPSGDRSPSGGGRSSSDNRSSGGSRSSDDGESSSDSESLNGGRPSSGG